MSERAEAESERKMFKWRERRIKEKEKSGRQIMATMRVQNVII